MGKKSKSIGKKNLNILQKRYIRDTDINKLVKQTHFYDPSYDFCYDFCYSNERYVLQS